MSIRTPYGVRDLYLSFYFLLARPPLGGLIDLRPLSVFEVGYLLKWLSFSPPSTPVPLSILICSPSFYPVPFPLTFPPSRGRLPNRRSSAPRSTISFAFTAMDHPFLLTSTQLRSYSLPYPDTVYYCCCCWCCPFFFFSCFFFFCEKNPRIPRFPFFNQSSRIGVGSQGVFLFWLVDGTGILFYSFYLFSTLWSWSCFFRLFARAPLFFLLFYLLFMIFSGENTGLQTDAMKARCGISYCSSWTRLGLFITHYSVLCGLTTARL